jgi:predicted dehydrogenase
MQGTLAAGSAIALTSPRVFSQSRGSNERIRMAIAGVHGRGGSHIGNFAQMKDVEIVYLVDPDKRLFDSKSKAVRDLSGGRSDPRCLTDIREALEDKSLDAISIATPNHWHSLMSIWACQAGKDVYVEKPLSHNVHEGRVLVEAAHKNKCIVQHGTQRRSSPGWAKAIAALHSGKLGKLKLVKGYCHKGRGSIGFKEEKRPPSELDWNIWQGPIQKRPFHENYVHYNWHWFWDTGNGDIGNQGVHQMDVGLWGIKGATLPKSVVSFGGRFGYEDQGQTANTQISVMNFDDDVTFIFSVRGLETPRKVANEFFTEHGKIVEGKWYPDDGGGKEADLPDVEWKLGPGGEGNNFANFIAAVKTRKESDLNAPVEVGHYASALGHLSNMSYLLGKKQSFEPKTRFLEVDPHADKALDSMEEHLEANGIKLEDTEVQLGRYLMVDRDKEKIVGDREANMLLSRKYRKPFVVPDKV